MAVVQQAEANGRALRQDAPVFSGDAIVTGPVGQAQVRFRDNTKLVVGPNSRLVIDAFIYSGNNTARKLSINALKGGFRFISGNSRHDAYNITTPTATIGVRGTQIDVNVSKGVVIYSGAAEVCKRGSGGSRNCVTIRGGCSLATFEPRQGVKKVSSIVDRNQTLLQNFQYAVNQRPLLPAFRADTASCGNLRAAGLIVPPDASKPPPIVVVTIPTPPTPTPTTPKCDYHPPRHHRDHRPEHHWPRDHHWPDHHRPDLHPRGWHWDPPDGRLPHPRGQLPHLPSPLHVGLPPHFDPPGRDGADHGGDPRRRGLPPIRWHNGRPLPNPADWMNTDWRGARPSDGRGAEGASAYFDIGDARPNWRRDRNGDRRGGSDGGHGSYSSSDGHGDGWAPGGRRDGRDRWPNGSRNTWRDNARHNAEMSGHGSGRSGDHGDHGRSAGHGGDRGGGGRSGGYGGDHGRAVVTAAHSSGGHSSDSHSSGGHDSGGRSSGGHSSGGHSSGGHDSGGHGTGGHGIGGRGGGRGH